MQPRKLQCCIWRDSFKPSLRFSWLCVFFVSKGNPVLLLFPCKNGGNLLNPLGPWVSTSLLVILSGGWLTGRIMFALNWPSIRIYQRYLSTRGGPKAGGSLHPLPRQPTAARRPPATTRSMPTARREPTAPEKENSPPTPQTLEINIPDTITVTRPPKTAQLTPSPYIQKPATPAPSPETPRAMRPRTKSPKYTTKRSTQYFHVNIENEYPLHEKYDLQDVHATTYKVNIKATRQPRKDEELNILFQYSSSTTKKTSTGYRSRGLPASFAGLGGSVGCAVRLETRRSRVQTPPRSATFFRVDWSWNIFYGHSLPSADSRRAVVSFWRKSVHNTGLPLRGLSLPSKRVVR